eukprot:TRINITY_DN21745_c0_g3_i1.p2 TRINITY_DN21745_c0_g3~~TRINITY_DN21745_c0_g3_i1.p2  ORF type:complete len:271 (-),score=103.59 TRINITY_DN21745_c0_g3_i1:1285-2097(-)
MVKAKGAVKSDDAMDLTSSLLGVRGRSESMAGAGIKEERGKQAKTAGADGSASGSPSGEASTPSDAKEKRPTSDKYGKKKQQRKPDEVVDMLEKVGQLALRSAMLHRVQAAITMDVWLLPSEGDLAKMCKKATQDYAEVMKAKDKEEFVSPPYIQVWDAVVSYLSGMTMKEETKDVALAKAIDEYKKEVVNVPEGKERAVFIAEGVRSCRLGRTHKKEVGKLEISTRSGTSADMLLKKIDKYIVKHCEADRKLGTAPRSGLERELQQLLG